MLKPIDFRPFRPFAILSLLLATAACGPNVYREAEAGAFKGSLFVMWVGEDRFVFVPDPDNPLTFTRPDGRDFGTIRPAMMYTDGGSIPPVARGLKGFSPWGYAPAYMIHDWLFLAHDCNAAGTPEGRETEVAEMEFIESAEIMAEAIRALIEAKRVSPNDVAPATISSAVAGPVARAIWDRPGGCERLTREDREAANAAIPGSPGAFRVPGARPATVVSVIEF